MHDIGVLSARPPVALDQHYVDLIHTAPTERPLERIASRSTALTHPREYAEELAPVRARTVWICTRTDGERNGHETRVAYGSQQHRNRTYRNVACLNDCVFNAIDGPCTSGKTTFAAMLNSAFRRQQQGTWTISSSVPNSARRNVSPNPAATDRERFETGSVGTARRTSRALPAMDFRQAICRRVRRRNQPAQSPLWKAATACTPPLRGTCIVRICLRSILPNSGVGFCNHAYAATIRRRVDSAGNRYFEATNIQAVADGRHRAAGRWVGRRAGTSYTHI